MKFSCIAKFFHTVLYSIITLLHEGFLCAFADEDVDIEVINPLSVDGTLLHILLQCGIPRNSLSAMIILSLRMESFCSVGMA